MAIAEERPAPGMGEALSDLATLGSTKGERRDSRAHGTLKAGFHPMGQVGSFDYSVRP
jgi:hypothetical protein